ncbi:hypothetical protein ACKWTF_005428 [Chironomus riparius]
MSVVETKLNGSIGKSDGNGYTNGHMNGNGIANGNKSNGTMTNGVNIEPDKPAEEYKVQIKWLNVVLFTYLHAAALYGMVLPWKWSSFISCFIYTVFAGFGTTVAAHRYFTHKAFKANKALRWILIFLQTACAQEPILNWARDHRVHHKFTDTDADPYNSRRGFFFSHIGWLLCKKHPEVIRQGRKIDMSDLECDPMLRFQRKYYHLIAFILNLVIPTGILVYMGEPAYIVWHGNVFRWVLLLNCVWCVNSVAHLWGMKPYDKNISPTDSRFVGFVALGEGWHNYHHVFPWDYKTAELAGYRWNISTAFIDFFAWLGWATELKTVPDDIVRRRVLRTGDGSHPYSKELAEKSTGNNMSTEIRDTEHFWGFGKLILNLF